MKSINQIDFSEKKAFVRVDFNVPFDDAGPVSYTHLTLPTNREV